MQVVKSIVRKPLSEFSVSLASTARLATKYLRSHSGATLDSTKDPPATSGQPLSAPRDESEEGVRGANGSRNRLAVASMALKAVCRRDAVVRRLLTWDKHYWTH